MEGTSSSSSSSSSSSFIQSDVLSFGDKLNMEDLQSILAHLRPFMYSTSEKTTNVSPQVNQEGKGGMKEEGGNETEDATMMDEDTSSAAPTSSATHASQENAWTKEDHQQVIGLVHLALTLPAVASDAFETLGNIITQRIEKMPQTPPLSFSSISHQSRKHRNKTSSSRFVVSSTPFSPLCLSITLKEIHAQLRQSLQRNGVVWIDVTLKWALSLLTALEARQQVSSETISDPTSPSTSTHSSLDSLLLSLERTLEKRLSGHHKTDSDLLLELIDLLLTCYSIASSEASPSSSSSLFSPWSKERDLLAETCKFLCQDSSSTNEVSSSSTNSTMPMEVDSERAKFIPHLQWVLVVLANYYPGQVLNLLLQHILSDSNLVHSFSFSSTSSSSSSGLDEPVSSLTATLNFIVLRFVSHATEIVREGLRKAFPVFFSASPFTLYSSSASSSMSSPLVNEEGFRALLVMFSVSPWLFRIGIGLILDRLDSQLLLLDSPSSLDIVSILSKFSSEVSYILLLRLKDLGPEVYRFLVIVEELIERVKEGTPLFSVVNHFHNALLKSLGGSILYHISSTTSFSSPSKDEKLSPSLFETSSTAFLRALQSHILPLCQQLRFKPRTQVLGLALQLIGLTSDVETAVEIIFNLLIHPALPSPHKSYSSESKGVVGIGGNLSQNSHTLNVDGRTGVSEERSYHLRLVAESMKLLSLEHSQVQQKAISRFFNSIDELPSEDVIETLEDFLYLIHFHQAQSSKTESEGKKDGGISFAVEIASHWARLLSFVLHSHNSALRQISFELLSFILSLRRTKEKGTEEEGTTVTLSNTKSFDVDIPHHVWSKQSASSSSSKGVSIISKFDTYLICRSLLNVFFTLVDLLENPRGNHGEHLHHVEEEEQILQHTMELIVQLVRSSPVVGSIVISSTFETIFTPHERKRVAIDESPDDLFNSNKKRRLFSSTPTVKINTRSGVSSQEEGVHFAAKSPTVSLLISKCLEASSQREYVVGILVDHLLERLVPSTLPIPSNEQYNDTLPKKNTFERDAHVQKTLQRYPVLFNLLELASDFGPEFCRCIEIVKSLLTNLIGLWNLQENTTYPSSSSSSSITSSSHSSLSLPLFTPTVRLGEILRRSQILIPPLCHSVEFLDGKTTLTPSEITNVLMSFWTFIRDHPPSTQEYVVTSTATSSPASLASSVPSVSFLRQIPNCDVQGYLSSVKQVLRANISTLAPFFFRLYR